MKNKKCIKNNFDLAKKYINSTFEGQNKVDESAKIIDSQIENCQIGENVEIANSILKNCQISANSKIGTLKQAKSARYFGTDGIRGIFGKDLTEQTAINLAKSLCANQTPKIVLGRDTRDSGKLLHNAFVDTVKKYGGTVVDLGVCTTPAVAYYTVQQKADYGVVITASHNSVEYNGLKVLGKNGEKISDDEETRLENLFDSDINQPENFGKVKKLATSTYEQEILNLDQNKFDGLKIILDCANGATCVFAPKIFEALHADVIKTFTDGIINHKCGATQPETLAKLVVQNNADLGFAFDGDGDRVIAVNSKGQILDGDDILFILAFYYKNLNKLQSSSIVGTQITNLGIENKIKSLNLRLVRAKVGDKNVVDLMKSENAELGGEQSGHIMLKEHNYRSDGLLIARILTSIFAENKNIFWSVKENNYMQAHKTIKLDNPIQSSFFETAEFKSLINFFRHKLKGGQIVVRPSGTEPKIRIMVECTDWITANIFANEIRKKLILLMNNNK